METQMTHVLNTNFQSDGIMRWLITESHFLFNPNSFVLRDHRPHCGCSFPSCLYQCQKQRNLGQKHLEAPWETPTCAQDHPDRGTGAQTKKPGPAQRPWVLRRKIFSTDHPINTGSRQRKDLLISNRQASSAWFTEYTWRTPNSTQRFQDPVSSTDEPHGSRSEGKSPHEDKALSQMILATIYSEVHQPAADKGHNGEDRLQCHMVSQSRKGDSKPKPQVQSVSKHVPAMGRNFLPLKRFRSRLSRLSTDRRALLQIHICVGHSLIHMFRH